MYSTSPSAIPNPVDDDDRRRRGSEAAVNNATLPSISTRSPTHYLPYPPTNGTHPPSPYHTYSSRPSTAAAMPALAGLSPRLGPPPSPKGPSVTHGGPASMLRDTGGSTYYDPLSEHREGPTSRSNLSYPSTSPVQVWYISNDQSSVHLDRLIRQNELTTMCRLAINSRFPPFVRSPRSPLRHISLLQHLFFRRHHRLSHSHMRIHPADTARSPSPRLNPSAHLRYIVKATPTPPNGSAAPRTVHSYETRAVENRRARFDRDRVRSPGPPEHRIRWRSQVFYPAMIRRKRLPVQCLPRDNFESP